MSLTRHAYRLPFHFKPPQDYIWVSEDVLDNAMRRFAHTKTTRRNVSLAPGPLEARKRETKRRMMNLAQMVGEGGFDPAVLQGLGTAQERRDWQWQSPKPPEAKNTRGTTLFSRSMACRRADARAEPESLPSWLTHSGSKHQNQVWSNGKAELEIQQPLRHDTMKSDPTVLAELKLCQSLDQVRDWATEHNVELRNYSRLAFRQLVQGGRNLSTVLQALEEPALDTSGNRTYFLQRELQSLTTRIEADLLGTWIKRRLLLGTLPEKEILNMANLLSFTPEVGENEDVRCILADSMFVGIQSSTVFGVRHVKAEVLGALFKAVAQGQYTRRSQTLGITIFKVLQPGTLWQLRGTVALFFQKSLRAQVVREYDAEEVSQLEMIARILELLRIFPENVVHDTIHETSKALLELRSDLSVSHQALVKILDNWWSSLIKQDMFGFPKKGTDDINNQGTASTRSQRMLADQPLEILVPYLRHFDDEGKARFLVRHWLCPALPPVEWRRAKNRFFVLRKTRKDESPFLHFISIANDNSQLSDQELRRFFSLLQMMQMSEIIEHILLRPDQKHMCISEAVVLHCIRTHVAEQPQIAERLMRAYPRLPLETCPDLAQELILNPSIHPDLLLNYHRSYSVHAIIPRAACRTRRQRNTDRARLLGKMALAYSEALHQTPRMAYRRIYGCYRCIMREHLGSIPVDIVRALVRSGIVRPLQQGAWVSTVKHRWILPLIRQKESLEDAERVDELVYQWRGANVRLRLSRRRPGKTLEASATAEHGGMDSNLRTQ